MGLCAVALIVIDLHLTRAKGFTAGQDELIVLIEVKAERGQKQKARSGEKGEYGALSSSPSSAMG